MDAVLSLLCLAGGSIIYFCEGFIVSDYFQVCFSVLGLGRHHL